VVTNQKHNQCSANAKEPQISVGDYDTEKVHSSVWIFIGLTIRFILHPDNPRPTHNAMLTGVVGRFATSGAAICSIHTHKVGLTILVL